MQQRAVVKHFDTFDQAHKAKEKLQVKFPDDNYKIRRVASGFNVVKRFKVNDILSVTSPNSKTLRRLSKDTRRKQWV